MRRITLNEDDMGCSHHPNNRLGCGTCGRNWCSLCHPTPAARCPYEYDHTGDEYTPFGRDDKRTTTISEEDADMLRRHSEVANRPKPKVGMVICDCKYKHQKIVEVQSDGDTILLEDGWTCSYIHCCNNVPHFDWAHPSGPCPICGEYGGFHDDTQHRNNIDPKYLKDKGWHLER